MKTKNKKINESLELVFEDVYKEYTPQQKLSILSEYLSKIPGSNTKKFVKCLVFTPNGVAIYNVNDILISESIAKGTATETPGKKVVRIIYTGDQASKTYTMKSFANKCKQILKNLDGVDPKDVDLQVAEEGQNKGNSFRFYYDDSKDFAIFARNCSVKNVKEFIETFEDDLLTYVNVPVSTKAPKAPKTPKAPREKKDKKPSMKDEYQLIYTSDEFGHKVRLWKKIKPEDRVDVTGIGQ